VAGAGSSSRSITNFPRTCARTSSLTSFIRRPPTRTQSGNHLGLRLERDRDEYDHPRSRRRRRRVADSRGSYVRRYDAARRPRHHARWPRIGGVPRSRSIRLASYSIALIRLYATAGSPLGPRTRLFSFMNSPAIAVDSPRSLQPTPKPPFPATLRHPPPPTHTHTQHGSDTSIHFEYMVSG